MPRPGVAVSIQQKKTSAGVATLGISTDFDCIVPSSARRCFYANGRFWAFYSDGVNLVYVSSADGVNWTAPVSVGLCWYGYHCAVYFDGVYVHYSRYHPLNLYYRRGIPNADGTITWSADEQTIYTGTLTDVHYSPIIAVDSLGYAWIGTLYYDGTDYLPTVLKNAKKDGSWTTAAGFPYTLNTTSGDDWWVTIVSLTKGKVYVVYARGVGALPYYLPLGRLYDGESWESEEDDLADYEVYGGYTLSLEAYRNDVHFVYLAKPTIGQIRYNKRIYGVGWLETDELVAEYPTDFTAVQPSPSLCLDTMREIAYCFWILWSQVGGAVRYKASITGKWDNVFTQLIAGSKENPTGHSFNLASFRRGIGGKVGVLHTTGIKTPMNVRFCHLNAPGTLIIGKSLFGK